VHISGYFNCVKVVVHVVCACMFFNVAGLCCNLEPCVYFAAKTCWGFDDHSDNIRSESLNWRIAARTRLDNNRTVVHSENLINKKRIKN